MKSIAITSSLGLIVLAACSAATVPRPSQRETSLDAGMSVALAGGKCVVGQQKCFCPDGTETGTQFCDARQELSTCMCAAVSTTGSTAGVMGDPTHVCSDLAGKPGCNATSYVSPQVPASILFVVDKSGSMACNAPPIQDVAACEADPKRLDPSQPSKWETTIKALDDAFAGLSGSNAAIGLTFFSTDGYCGADSTPVVGVDSVTPTQLMALSDALQGGVPAGSTPIVGATILAYNHLHEELHAKGNRYVVLITDGSESCGTKGDDSDKADLAAARDRLLDVEVQKARMANIKTFVIGSPGSDTARGFLSELAFQGGTARSPTCVHGDRNSAMGDCHFDLSKEADFAKVLKDSLGKISGEALGCEFQTPIGGNANVNVQYSQNGGAPTCFPHDISKPCDGGANGWQFAKHPDGSDDLTRVILCGAACDTVKADPTTVVDVILGCQSLE